MPTGSYSFIPYVAHHLCMSRPQRVLDLGIGMGIYGAVVRQWLDLGVKPWRTYLVGVEAWAEYGNPLWDLYNLVVVDTIQNYLVKQNERFDFVILSDVIEHFDKQDGTHLIHTIRQIVSPGGRFMVGTPAVHIHQGALYGNEFERHRALWTRDDFQTLGFRVLLDGQPDRFGNRVLLVEEEKA